MPRSPRTPQLSAEARPVLPHRYEPREYQTPFWAAMLGGTRYAALVWHRRAGKDTTAFNWMIAAAMRRVGSYYYFFPTFTLGKKILWDGRNKEGMRFLDHIPPELIAYKNESDLRIGFPNGSSFQIIGTDNFDSIRGTNPVGCVFSEYAAQDPRAWEVVRPILRENGGWAVFTYTPLGRNHGYKLFEMAKSNPEWFAQKLTVKDTGVFSEADIEAERAAGADEEYIQQEYYCSFSGSVQGSFYANELRRAYEERRIARYPYDPQYPVETGWDIGTKDANAIWFYQQIGRRVVFIDYHEVSGSNLIELAKVIREKPYLYLPGYPHIAPHDIRRTEYSTGRTIYEMAFELGLRFRVVPKMNPLERIAAGRVLFPRAYFDEELCQQGLAALAQYHKEWDENTRAFKLKPEHDWSSHGADAFGHVAVGIQEPVMAPMPTQAVTHFNPLDYERELQPASVRVERDFNVFGA